MKINEIFYSIQGEGKWSGLPNIFIRTTGCNLRCSFCDTRYAYYEGEELSIDEIENKIKNYNCRYVCITGGEPLLQTETISLIKRLLKKGYKICIETNGSKSVKEIPKSKNVVISLDIKCPSSGMHDKMIFENISFLSEKDQIKFVIKDRNDYEYAKEIIKKYKPHCPVFLQPVWGSNLKEFAEWIKEDDLDLRLSLQIHKIIWGEEKGK